MTLMSQLGHLKHANAHTLTNRLLDELVLQRG